MRILVTGSAGHLGEALVRTLLRLEHEVIGLDIMKSPFTNCVGSITDRGCVRRCMGGVQRVFHAASLHKPHTRRSWKMFPSIDRVYVDERAQRELGWAPRFDFPSIIERLRAGEDLRSPLALLIGSKGYHPEVFHEGPYPVE